MDKELKKNLEEVVIDLDELSQVTHVMWLGLQNEMVDMEHALSCMSYTKEGLINFKERLEDIIEKYEEIEEE